ncbi:hypothetical protein WDU94_009977 [Cyamophila willieti]
MFTLLVPAIALISHCSLVHGWKATLWELPNYKGEKYHFEGNDCYQYLGDDFNDKASSIDTHGTCVRLYADAFCEADNIDVFPGSLFHKNLKDLGFQQSVSSLGPCLAPWKITLWEYPDYKGAKFTYNGTDCLDSLGDGKASSLNTHGTCVRLYKNAPRCEGDEHIDVFPGSFHHRDLSYLGFHDSVSSLGPCPPMPRKPVLSSLYYTLGDFLSTTNSNGVSPDKDSTEKLLGNVIILGNLGK